MPGDVSSTINEKHLIPPCFPNDFFGKFCSSSTDDPHHLFFECPAAKYLISCLEPILTETLKKPFTLNCNCLYDNFTHLTGTPHTITTKMASLIRLTLIQIQNHSLSFHTLISTSMLNENLYKIQTKFKTFLKNFSTKFET